MRLLLIAFYFPPAGGGGVQRTLKFCRHLPEFGVDVDVLAPSDPKWFAVDEPLLHEIPAATTVHRSRFLGPRSSFRGDALRGSSGLRRAAVHARYAYERALIPDKAAPWAATAVPAAVRIVRRRHIDAIMTTSPPPSVHLIGAAVAAATSRPWVADLRDSWLAHPHRRYERRGVRAKRAVERTMARTVARRANALVAVTEGIAAELRGLDPSAAGKTHVIGHGVDLSDFDGLAYAPEGPFTIVHTGAFFGQRSPRPFLTAVRDLLDRRPDLRGQVRVRFIGDLRASDRAWARALKIDDAWEETGFLPFRRGGRRPALGRRAAASDPACGRARRHRHLGQGVRVSRRPPPGARGRAAGRRGGGAPALGGRGRGGRLRRRRRPVTRARGARRQAPKRRPARHRAARRAWPSACPGARGRPSSPPSCGR